MAGGAVDGLSGVVRGRVVEQGSPDYDEAPALYNAMIDKRPVAVVYCLDERDVAAAIGFAQERGLRLAIRSGGHNGGCLGSVDDGLVIDLSPMNAVSVDADASMVLVQGGAKLGEVDAATAVHGLVVPAGVISTTGVGGLTLGGGVGHLSRGFGLTIDKLVAATVVLADGSVVETDAEREPGPVLGDPWRRRELRCGHLVQVPSAAFAGLPSRRDLSCMTWPTPPRCCAGTASSCLPSRVNSAASSLSLESRRGRRSRRSFTRARSAEFAWTYVGEDDSDALREARSFGKPRLLDGISPLPLPGWNSAFDGVYPPGDQWYWRGEFVRTS